MFRKRPSSPTSLLVCLKAEVAQLRAEMWREHSYEPLLVEQLQWQIDRLAEEVVELNHRVQELE
ncbi:MAG: hypothetical protein R3C10_22165 [Pirellulales bacterium]